MIDPEKVLKHLKIMTEIDLETEEKALALCSEAASQLENRLRSPLCGDDPRVIAAAAAIALTSKIRSDAISSVGISSFKAGDVTVDMDAKSEDFSKAVLNDALAAAAPCLTDSEFFFREV